MPLILDQLGVPVFSGYFDEPEEPDFTEDRIVNTAVRPPSTATFANLKKTTNDPLNKAAVMPSTTMSNSEEPPATSRPSTPPTDNPPSPHLPIHAGFNLNAIKDVLQGVEQDHSKSQAPPPSAKKFFSRFASPPTAVPFKRPQSTPPNNQPIEDTAPRTITRSASR
ncbi:hypothetical protein BYT27DRAFT_7250955 [Phlegmacium glaucopus]|nr:hypothetical protein BYT27DRAFT_7250955 [Phlegmacium glaucopus]